MKATEIAPRIDKGGKMTALRLDSRIRYFADLATLVTGRSLTGHLEAALFESFKHVTLRIPSKPEPMYLGNSGAYEVAPIDAEQERVKNEAMTIANLADSLWSESEFERIQSLSILAEHLVSNEDNALMQYIHARTDLQTPSGIGYKLNRAKIDREWESIKADFASTMKAGRV